MEMNATPARSDPSVLIKMEAAINAHDIDTFVNCFANEFVSEQSWYIRNETSLA